MSTNKQPRLPANALVPADSQTFNTLIPGALFWGMI
jgi:hypothetical protein